MKDIKDINDDKYTNYCVASRIKSNSIHTISINWTLFLMQSGMDLKVAANIGPIKTTVEHWNNEGSLNLSMSDRYQFKLTIM